MTGIEAVHEQIMLLVTIHDFEVNICTISTHTQDNNKLLKYL